jgi:hypothetical protein
MADDGSKRMLMGKKRFLSFMRATAGYTEAEGSHSGLGDRQANSCLS